MSIPDDQQPGSGAKGGPEEVFVLDDLELDALTELVNLGVSRAALSLRGLVHEQVLLSVPTVRMLSRAQAACMLSERNPYSLIAVRQAFEGEFSGRALLIFPETNSLEIVRAVAGADLSLDDIVELEQEALAEVGNIILNGCVATIANLLRRSLRMSMPEIVRGTAADLFEVSPPRRGEVVLFIRINFTLKGREISGYVAMIMDLLSLAVLKKLVIEFIRQAT